jgi:hypoxanthine-DNA glycosylase
VSLRLGQYYAHPRNLFWQLMSDLVDVPPSLVYDERIRALDDRGIALWDSLKHCQRPGSLDQHIVRVTEVPNDFMALLTEHPTIQAIAFNGKKSEAAFRRHVQPSLPQAMVNKLHFRDYHPAVPPTLAQPTSKATCWRVILNLTCYSAK